MKALTRDLEPHSRSCNTASDKFPQYITNNNLNSVIIVNSVHDIVLIPQNLLRAPITCSLKAIFNKNNKVLSSYSKVIGNLVFISYEESINNYHYTRGI